MGSAFLVQAFKPLLLFVMLLASIPFTMAIKRWMRDGKLKRTLLDRELLTRRPWIHWAIFVFGFVFMFAMGFLGLVIHNL